MADKKSDILLTGASGMLGGYVAQVFGENIHSLGRGEGNTTRCNLETDIPDFGEKTFDLVIHCAGTEDDLRGDSLNYKATDHLLKAFEKNLPQFFVYVSSWQVYSRDAGEKVTEECNIWATSEAGKSKARAERLVTDWAQRHGVTLTIVRPARMFGSRVGGETLQLFNDAVNGKYIHIRGNDARVSIVTAYDVARAIKSLYKNGGIYNLADGHDPRFIDMIEAMTANAGCKKRMAHLPAGWAEWLWRLGRWIPLFERNLNPEVVEKRMKTLTLDSSKARETASISFFNTINVIEHTAPDYPYESDKPDTTQIKHEA